MFIVMYQFIGLTQMTEMGIWGAQSQEELWSQIDYVLAAYEWVPICEGISQGVAYGSLLVILWVFIMHMIAVARIVEDKWVTGFFAVLSLVSILVAYCVAYTFNALVISSLGLQSPTGICLSVIALSISIRLLLFRIILRGMYEEEKCR